MTFGDLTHLSEVSSKIDLGSGKQPSNPTGTDLMPTGTTLSNITPGWRPGGGRESLDGYEGNGLDGIKKLRAAAIAL